MYQQLPTIQAYYPLDDLLQPDELETYSKGPIGLTFLTPIFKEIWQDPRARERCEAISKSRWGWRDCRACAIQANPPTSPEPVEAVCAAGLLNIRAAVVVRGKTIGYVAGPQIPCADLFEQDLNELPSDTREWLEAHRNTHVDTRDITAAVGYTARRLSRRCTLERRLRILRDTRARFVAAKDSGDVLVTACHALESLFGDIEVCFYVLQENGFLNLITARGPSAHAMPASLRPEQGHVGRVIRTRDAHYQKDLEDDPEFIHPDPNNRFRSAFTVPIPWGPDEAPGALQAASKEQDHFPRYDRQAMEAVAQMAGLAAVKLSLQAAKSVSLTGYVAADTWASIGLAVTATTTDAPVDILQAKSRLYAGFAEEALRVSGAQAACVGVWDERNGTVRVAATAGDGWTEEAKMTFSNPQIRNAVRYALDYDNPLDAPDTKSDDRFKTILPFTNSLYIVPFRLKRDLGGVLSLSSSKMNGFEGGIKDAVKNLSRQFELVLAAVHTREDALFQRMSTDNGLPTIANAWVDLIRRAFRVRSCSLFLSARDADRVELYATTGPMPQDENPSYEFGEGLTGWIARSRQSLRIRDTNDTKELDAIAEGLRPKTGKSWREEIAGGDVNRTYLGVPLIAHNRLVGVIRVKVKEDLTAFTPEEQTALINAADRLAATINNVWIADEEAAKIRELEGQAALQRQITEAEGLQGVCQVLVDEFMANTGAIAAQIIILDESPGYDLELTVTAGLLKGLRFDNHRIAKAALGILPRRTNALFEENVAARSEWRPVVAPIADRFPGASFATIVSAATLPFSLDENIFAVLLLCWNTPQVFDPERCERLNELVARVIEALRPSALRRHTDVDLGRRVDELTRFRQIGLGFAQTHNLTLLMDQILDVSLKESQMERGAIRLLDGGRLVLKVSDKIPPEVMPQALEINAFFKRSVDSDKCVFLPDVSKDELWVAHSHEGTPQRRTFMRQVRSILHVPIRLHGECVGLILLDSSQSRVVSQQVQEYLEILGLYAAVAIDFARMRNELQEQIELAQPLAMMGTMLQGFLHVIRNHVNDLFAILGNVLDSPLETTVRDQANEMREQLKRLHRVCNDLALFTRMDPVSVSEKVPLTDLVERTLGDFGSSLRDRDIVIIKKLCAPSPVLIGNPVQIEIAFKMLVQNALEAMDEGGQLTVESIADPAAARVVFRDTGRGMNAATMRSCMQPFFTTKGDHGGTGLGLAVVFGIMTRHKGRIEVQSEPGLGSCFTLSFPMYEESAQC